MGSDAEGGRAEFLGHRPVGPSGLGGAGRLSRSLDQGQPKGLLTPGNPKMELRDPENQEDGDPEVRDGTQGGRERDRQTDKEVDAERNGVGERRGAGQGAAAGGRRRSRGTWGNREALETQNDTNPRTHSKTKAPEKGAQEQRMGSPGREEDGERERWVEWKGGEGHVMWVKTQPPSKRGASWGSHRQQRVGSLRQSPLTLPGHKNRWPRGLGESL